MTKRKQRHYSRDELVRMGKFQREALDVSAGTMKLVTLIVLSEKFEFDKDLLNEFVDAFEDVLAYYNNSDDYQARLMEWNDYIWETAGIRILPKKGDTCDTTSTK